MNPREVFGSNKCWTLRNRINGLSFMKMDSIRVGKEYQAHFIKIKSIKTKDSYNR